jgi:pyruvate-formate lyase
MINSVIAQAVEFTETYKKYKNAPVSIREAMCYKTQYPALLPGIRFNDIFAGRRSEKRIVYIGSVWWFGFPDYTPENKIMGKQGGYCFDFSAVYTLPQNEEEKKILDDLTAFWKTECNIAKIYANAEIKDGVGFLFSNNLEKLVKEGLPGLIQSVSAMKESDFRTGLMIVLETVIDVCRYYQKQAEEMELKETAENLSAIIEHEPRSLAQALQLILIYELLSHEDHYEINRFDAALGDLYIQEINSGTLTEEQAIGLIHSFYKMIYENGTVTVCRLMMGGKGRNNEKNADLFIQAALKAEQRHKQVIPQVSLRLYDGMNPEILKLAYDTINESYTFPALYNDDTVIGGVAGAFDVSLKEAENYYPLGCGEFIIAPKSPAILCSSWDVPKTINAGIRGSNAETFDELYESVLAQIKKDAAVFARYHKLLVDTNKSRCAFLMASLLMDDCLQKEKPLLEGGAGYTGACVMGHGFSNAADALTAIKKLVYDEKTYSLDEILKALDENFEGYENLRKELSAVPKYGNDDDEADKMLVKLWRDMSDETKKAGKEQGFDFFTVSSVNPGGYQLGEGMSATADGRLKGGAYAIGNAPSAGADKNGLTALMNSILKTDPVNGGSVTNFKISREFFAGERGKFEDLFSAYWSGGGLQANITILNKGDLEAAFKEPEKFPHLLVRLGGWTARFVELSPFIQKEIINRTLY